MAAVDIRLPDLRKHPDYQRAYEILAGCEDEMHLQAELRAALLADRYMLAVALGYDDETHPWDNIQLILLDRMQDYELEPGVQVAELATRDTYKTAREEIQITSCILNDPNLTCGVGSWKLDVSRMIVLKVKLNLEKPIIRWLFPDIVPDPRKADNWQKSEFTVHRDTATKDPTLYAFSLEAMPTSHHFDRMFLDDVIEKRSTRTEEAVEKANQALRDVRSLRNGPNAQIFLRGTFWDPDDFHVQIYSQVIPGWNVERHPAIVDAEYLADNPLKLKVGEPLYPLRKPLSELEKDRAQMLSWQFNTQMLLKIPGALGAAWTEEQVSQRIGMEDIDIPYNALILCDLAGGGADEVAIGVGLIQTDGTYILADGYAGACSPTFAAEQLYEFQKTWGGVAVIEEISLAQFFEVALKHEADRRGYMIPHRAVKIRASSKTDRIWSLDPVIRAGKFKIRKDEELTEAGKYYMSQWINQARRFPNVSHDDVLDNAADLVIFGTTPMELQQPANRRRITKRRQQRKAVSKRLGY